MDERKAAALLKQRFESAGFKIAENVTLDEDGINFEVDGFDADRRVGYEYVSRESGDGWDVDADVIAELAERRAAGTLSIFVVDEHAAPDEASLGRAADAFLASLGTSKSKPKPAAKSKPPPRPPAAKSKGGKPKKK